MILIGAQVFNTFLVLSGIPAMLASWMGNLPLPNSIHSYVVGVCGYSVFISLAQSISAWINELKIELQNALF